MIADFLGKEIKVGSKIVYPGRSGSHLWMNQGEVISLGMATDYYGTPHNYLKVKRKSRWNEDEKIVTLIRIDYVTVIGE